MERWDGRESIVWMFEFDVSEQSLCMSRTNAWDFRNEQSRFSVMELHS